MATDRTLAIMPLGFISSIFLGALYWKKKCARDNNFYLPRTTKDNATTQRAKDNYDNDYYYHLDNYNVDNQQFVDSFWKQLTGIENQQISRILPITTQPQIKADCYLLALEEQNPNFTHHFIHSVINSFKSPKHLFIVQDLYNQVKIPNLFELCTHPNVADVLSVYYNPDSPNLSPPQNKNVIKKFENLLNCQSVTVFGQCIVASQGNISNRFMFSFVNQLNKKMIEEKNTKLKITFEKPEKEEITEKKEIPKKNEEKEEKTEKEIRISSSKKSVRFLFTFLKERLQVDDIVAASKNEFEGDSFLFVVGEHENIKQKVGGIERLEENGRSNKIHKVFVLEYNKMSPNDSPEINGQIGIQDFLNCTQ